MSTSRHENFARPATLYDVAKVAGVSHQTVSNVIKGVKVRPENLRRTLAAIQELNYRPNIIARSLATSRNNRIGALFFDRFTELGPTLGVQAVADRAREAGYLLEIISLDTGSDEDLKHTLAQIDQWSLAGIMVFAPNAKILAAVESLSFRVPIYADFAEENVKSSGQYAANVESTRLIVEHLAGLGHRRFFFIGGPGDWFAARSRYDTYREELSDLGLVSVGRLDGAWSARSGYELGHRVPLDQGITALVVANDQMAIGAMKALRERGVRVPEQISVAGFDNFPEGEFIEPALTTVDFDFDGQGRLAMEGLLRMIDPELDFVGHPPLTARLVPRESTAATQAPIQSALGE